MKKHLILSVLTLIGFSKAAFAVAPQVLGEYGDWIAYYYRDKAGPVCYMASTPKKDEGKYTKRGDIYIVVTHRPNEKSFDVVNINAGYTYKPRKDVEMKIGAQTFSLFSSGGTAWTRNDADDAKIVTAMKRGSRMIVNGVSEKNTKTKDTYSLNGFTSAYKAISNKCRR